VRFEVEVLGRRSRAGADVRGAFYTLVPIRPRRRGERRSLRTFAGASLRPGSLAFNPRPRRLSTPPDAFEIHPDVRSIQARGDAVDDVVAAATRSGAPPTAEFVRALRREVETSGSAAAGRVGGGAVLVSRPRRALFTLVPIRPRSRGVRRSLRTFGSRRAEFLLSSLLFARRASLSTYRTFDRYDVSFH
jgi:hypothetical protein